MPSESPHSDAPALAALHEPPATGAGSPRPSTPARPSILAPRSSPAARAARGLTALATGAAVAAIVVLGRAAGVLDGVVGLALLVGLLLAAPTSTNASRRVLLSGALAFGAAPLLYLVDLPTGGLGRVTWGLSILAGGLTTWTLWRGPAEATDRARRLVPRLRTVDALPLVAAAGAALCTSPWWRIGDAATAVTTLGQGWDQSAHFSMTSMIRRHGLTIDRLPQPGGEHWKFVEYPQGFHSATAALMETVAGPQVGPVADELVLYTRALVTVLVVACALAAAGIAALPWARRHVAATFAATAAVVATIAVVPGGVSFVSGFPNFVVAAVLTACVPLLAVTMPRVPMPLHLAALAALGVSVAQGWLLLLVIAAPAAVALTLRRGAWRGSRSDWAWTAAIAVAAVAGVVWVVRTIYVLDASQVLAIPGAITTYRPSAMVACALATPALLFVARRLHPMLGRLALAPAVGVAAVALLGLYQRATAGAFSYYFWKLLLGLLIVDVILLVAGAAVALPRLRVRVLDRVPGWRTAVSLIAVAGLGSLLVVSGNLGPGRSAFPTYPPGVSTDPIIRAAELVGAPEAADVAPEPYLLLLPPDPTTHPLRSYQWFLAMTGRWTSEANTRGDVLLTPLDDVGQVTQAARTALDASPQAQVVTTPELAAELRAAFPDAADRVVSWG